MSDNTAVATVSGSGLVTALNGGTANIIVTTHNNIAAVCAVTVGVHNSGIDECAAPTPRHHISNGSLIIDAPCNVAIYRSDGSLFYSGRTGCVENLPKGFLILRINDHTIKTLVE